MPFSLYAPNDAGISIKSLEFCRTAEGRRLLDAAAALFAAHAEPTVSEVAALRRDFPPDHVHAALVLVRLQSKATGVKGKFPNSPFFWATPEALEQATSMSVARHKATRFGVAGPSAIVDLCAGIGGDALALADIAPTTAVELSPIRAKCLEFNAADHRPPSRYPLTAVAHDLLTALPTVGHDALFHIDPARRSGGRRSPRYQDLIPGPDVLQKVIAHFAGGAIKLSPAVDFDSLPPGHLELISHNGTVVQAVLWINVLDHFPPNTRTATVLSDRYPAFSLTARAGSVAASTLSLPPDSMPAYLYELDGALTRANLAAALAAAHALVPITSDGGYLLSAADAPLISHPALTAFRLLMIVPYSEKRLGQALREMVTGAVGPVEVKSRGHLPGIETDHLQLAWSKITPFRVTVLIFRRHNHVLAAIASRIASVM